MSDNPCFEVALSTERLLMLGGEYNPLRRDTPTMTYPTVTRWGIREMTRAQQENLAGRNMSTLEMINDLRNRVNHMEAHIQELHILLKDNSKK